MLTEVEKLIKEGFAPLDLNKLFEKKIGSEYFADFGIKNADAVFYTHELKEAELVASGVEQSIAHEMALQYYEVSPYSVYHPDVISMEPEWWNNAWFEFWNIER